MLLVRFVFFVCLVVCGNAGWNNKLQIQVDFEWLCSDSEQFIANLNRHWDTIGPHVDVKFVPFGKSTSLPDGRFICQHGPLECKGNRFMSCALARITDQTAQVKFLDCFMSNNKNGLASFSYSIGLDQKLNNCATLVGLNFADTMRCFSSQEGTDLQLQAELATKGSSNMIPNFVPNIKYDNVFDQSLQDNSISDVKGTVCQLLERKSIATCSNRRSLFSSEYEDESTNLGFFPGIF